MVFDRSSSRRIMKRALAERVKQEMGDPVAPPGAPPSYGGRMNGVVVGEDRGRGGDHPGHPSKIPRAANARSSAGAPRAPAAAPASASPRDVPGDVAALGGGTTTTEAHAASSAAASKKRPRTPPDASGSGNEAAYRTHQNYDRGAAPGSNGRGPGRPRKSPSAAPQDRDDSADEEDAENSSFYLKLQNASLASELFAYRRRIYLLEREREFRRRGCRAAGRKIGELSGAWGGLECAIGKELESNALLKRVRCLFAFFSPLDLCVHYVFPCTSH